MKKTVVRTNLEKILNKIGQHFFLNIPEIYISKPKSPIKLYVFVISPPQEIISYEGLPSTSYHIKREGYFIAYDPRTKNPIYVYKQLSSNCLSGRVSGDNFNFKEDELIPKIFRSTTKDYLRSGYDRGHLAPAANHKDSEEAMSDTFFQTYVRKSLNLFGDIGKSLKKTSLI